MQPHLSVAERLIDDVDWTLDDVMMELEPAFAVRESILRDQTNKELRTQLLTISAYFGALLAYRREYTLVLKPLYDYAM